MFRLVLIHSRNFARRRGGGGKRQSGTNVSTSTVSSGSIQGYMNELRRRQHLPLKFTDPSDPLQANYSGLSRSERVRNQVKFYFPRMLGLAVIAFWTSMYLNREDKTDFLLTGGIDIHMDIILNSNEDDERSRCLTTLLTYSQSNHRFQELLIARYGSGMIDVLIGKSDIARQFSDEQIHDLARCFQQACEGSPNACAALMQAEGAVPLMNQFIQSTIDASLSSTSTAPSSSSLYISKCFAFSLVSLARHHPALLDALLLRHADTLPLLIDFWTAYPEYHRRKFFHVLQEMAHHQAEQGLVAVDDKTGIFLRTKPPSALREWLGNGYDSLFLHTGVGGLIWGAAVGVYKGQRGQALLRSAARTSFISTIVPFYFVSFVVGNYLEYRKYQNTSGRLIATDFIAACSILPAFPALRYVEARYPYWLGGHILGIAFFITRMTTKNADFLAKDDHLVQKHFKKEKK